MSEHAHKEEHFQGSQAVRDIVIGMADGLTVPFALTAGLSGAIDSNAIIITAGIAEIVAGSIAMGLGGYLAGTTEYEHYQSERRREYWEVENLPDKEKDEIREILEEYGISKELSGNVAEEMSKDKDKWVDFMMRFELELEEPHLHQAKRSAGNIAGAYIVGGFVPLAGYFMTDTPSEGLIFSSIFTVIALYLFGYGKSKLTGQSPHKGALKTTLVGIIASTAAYLIALWIG